MAIFQNEDSVFELLRINQQIPDWINTARLQHKELKALILGKDFRNLILKIEHIEKDSKKAEARKKYTRSVKDLNERLFRPLDNIYSSTGGSKQYYVKGNLGEEFIKTISKIRDNKSIEKWLQTYWIEDLYHADPNGIIFMEYKLIGDKKKPYPSYKSIDNIRNYKPNGQNIEWLIYEPEIIKEKTNKGSEVKKWRIVDDKYDYRVLQIGELFSIMADETFEHPFGQCPGIINSDVYDIYEGLRISPFDEILEIEKEYLRDLSIKTIFKFLRGIPKFWRYKMICPDCRGLGKKGVEICDSCDGYGFKKDSDVTDEVILPPPETSDDIKIAPDIAGYIEPPIDTWDKYDNELEMLENICHYTIWGTLKQKADNIEQTAFEVYANEKPLISRLNKYADTAQWVEWQITEWVANFIITTKAKDENISSISYGRDYIIEPADVIYKKYLDAKEKGSPSVILDKLLNEYITSKFKYDPQSLRIQLIKKELEPYVHYNAEDVMKYFGVTEARKKILYIDWIESLNYDDLIKNKIEKLQKDFIKWFNEKNKEYETKNGGSRSISIGEDEQQIRQESQGIDTK